MYTYCILYVACTYITLYIHRCTKQIILTSYLVIVFLNKFKFKLLTYKINTNYDAVYTELRLEIANTHSPPYQFVYAILI
jgi:hypothetical protein